MKHVAITQDGAWEELGYVEVYRVPEGVNLDHIANADAIRDGSKCILAVSSELVMGPGGMGDVLNVVTYDKDVMVDHS